MSGSAMLDRALVQGGGVLAQMGETRAALDDGASRATRNARQRCIEHVEIQLAFEQIHVGKGAAGARHLETS